MAELDPLKEDFSVYNGEGTVLRKAQLRMLDILIEVDKICKEHNIPYWIDYGTLLGAIRHGGFIPWDDDLDISVLKKDYFRLAEILERELPKDLAFQDWRNERKLTMKGGKVRDLRSYYDDGLTKRGEMKLQGIFIDIFPVEQIPSFKIKQKVDFFYGRAFRRLRGLNDSKREYIIALLMWPFANVLVLFSRFLALFMGKDLLANIHGGLNLPVSHREKDIFPLKEVTFEGMTFSGPNDPDTFLRGIYGNYMWVPPKQKRMTHASLIEFLD